IARLKDEGAQAAAVAEEEALRQIQTRMSELQGEIARLQTVIAASGEVAAFIDAQPDYRDPRWKHYQPPVTRQSLREHTAAFSLGESVPGEIRERFERC